MESIENVGSTFHNFSSWTITSAERTKQLRDKLLNHLILRNDENQIHDLHELVNFVRTHGNFVDKLSEKKNNRKVRSR